ncbi:hypothetical protein HYPSUDRAFT_431173 [Hypholoma sublateritium FD-334 SS-4]|uniref:Uncharacterized protein n=1 Tax=Hypholoma sublateritium (strain FD-334 SS-4) TaxID=945553 RepID=A0A0D2KIU3_HYPSF|nr:hypothetical protein HYPSUDRAFT_431173 [Hypholoma sublateritium FD-334 SS-4]
MAPKKGLQKLLSSISSRVGQKSKLEAGVSEPEEPWISIKPNFSSCQGSPNEPVPADYWDSTMNTRTQSAITSDSSSSYGDPGMHYPRSLSSLGSVYNPDERQTASAGGSVNPNPYHLHTPEYDQKNSVPFVYRSSSTARQSGTLDSRAIDTRPAAHTRDAGLSRIAETKASPKHPFNEQIPKSRLRQPQTSPDPLLQETKYVTAEYTHDSRSEYPGLFYPQVERLEHRGHPNHENVRSDNPHNHDLTKHHAHERGLQSSRSTPLQNAPPHAHNVMSAYSYGPPSSMAQDVQPLYNTAVDDYYQDLQAPEQPYQWVPPSGDISRGIYSADIFGYPTHRPSPSCRNQKLKSGPALNSEYPQPTPQFIEGSSSPPLLNIPERGEPRRSRLREGPGRSISQENDYSHLFRPNETPPASAPAALSRGFSVPDILPSERAARQRRENEGEQGVRSTGGGLRSAPIDRYAAYRAAIEEAELQKAVSPPPHGAGPGYSELFSSAAPGSHHGYS